MARRRSLIEDAKFDHDVINIAPIDESDIFGKKLVNYKFIFSISNDLKDFKPIIDAIQVVSLFYLS